MNESRAFFIHCLDVIHSPPNTVVEVFIPPCSILIIKKFVRDLEQKYTSDNLRDYMHNDTGRRRRSQFIIGKIGEVAAARLIGGWIDFRIWSRGLTFDPDITSPTHHLFKDKRVHVKTCNAKYIDKKRLSVSSRASWTLDRGDPIWRTPTDQDVIFLMFATLTQSFMLGFLYARDILDKWRDCFDTRLAHKIAIYYPDIKDKIHFMH